MLAATKAVDGGAGVVHIVKNYTGDVMNFKLAAEDAADEGIDVESVLIDDDVAVQDSLYTAGRRGVGATVLAEKIAGAAAERGRRRRRGGRDRAPGQRARALVRRRAVVVHAAGGRQADLRPPRGRDRDRHRHPRRAGPAPRGARHRRAGRRRDGRGRGRATSAPASGAQVLPFVNGMGGTPLLELYLLYGEIERGLRAAGLEPVRSLVGSYITSLEMAGASLTLLELDDELDAAVGCSRPHRRAPLGGVSEWARRSP